MNQRDVGEVRNLPAHGLVEQALAGGVVQVVVTADDVADVHVVVGDDPGEGVGRRAGRTQQHQVGEVAVAEGHLALDQIVDHGVAVLRPAEANGMGPCEVGGAGIAVAPGRAQGVAGGLGLLARGGQLVAAEPATVGLAGGQQLHDHGAMAVRARRLEHRLAVERQAQPVQAVKDHLHGGFGRARTIGVFDTQKEATAGVFRV